MALPTSQALRDWLAEDGQPSPIVTLYTIEIDDATTLRLVEGNPTGKPITYDGNEYTPAAIAREELTQSIEGELPSFRLGVSNIDGVAGGYIEQNDLEGRKVTITFVPLNTLDPADSLSESYTIQDQAYDRKAASVVLGHTHLFKRKLPFYRYIRPRCQWGYERRHDWLDPENGCRAYSDEFEDDTRQFFRAGAVTNGEQVRRFGWHTINALKANVWDTNEALISLAVIELDSNDVAWAGSSFDAPFMYRRLAGDFDVFTRARHRQWRAGGLFGILCQEALSGQDSWVYVARSREDLGADPLIRAASGQDGVDDAHEVLEEPDSTLLRLRRVGDVFTSFHSLLGPASLADYEAAWTEIDERTVPMDTEIRIGLFCGGSGTGVLGASFDYFRFASGGLADCDRTSDGEIGCRAHANIHRMFAFEGIPRR